MLTLGTKSGLFGMLLALLVSSSAQAGQNIVDVFAPAVTATEGANGRAWQRVRIAIPSTLRAARIDGAFLDVNVAAAIGAGVEGEAFAVLEIGEYSASAGAEPAFRDVNNVLSRLTLRAGTSRVMRLDVTSLVREAAARGDSSIDLVLGALTEKSAGSFTIGTLDELGGKGRLTVLYQNRFGNRASELGARD